MARATREEWRKRVERWKDSGLTAAEYAAEIGVNANTLSHWKWQLEAEARRKAVGDRPRKRTAAVAPTPAVPVVEVVGTQHVDVAAGFEIVVAGATLRVPAEFDDESVRRLLALLEGR